MNTTIAPDFANATALDWDKLYTSHFYRIFRFVYEKTEDPLLSEDLTAEAFTRAIDSDKRGIGPVNTFNNWIYRIAGNLVIDHYRKQKHRNDAPFDVIGEQLGVSNFAPQVEDALMAEHLWAWVHRLAPEQAEVIRLRFGEGYTNEEVASLMNKSIGSVKQLQCRGLKTLREWLQEQEL